MDLYFKRHDGSAVTCDDFLAAMADANGEDLSLMSRCGRTRADGSHSRGLAETAADHQSSRLRFVPTLRLRVL